MQCDFGLDRPQTDGRASGNIALLQMGLTMELQPLLLSTYLCSGRQVSAFYPHLQQAFKRYKQAEKKDNDTMTMKFLLHKDNKRKESPPHIQAHLSLPDKKANASQSQKSLHFAFAPRQSKY